MPSDVGVTLLVKFNFAQKIRVCGWSESYAMAYADLPSAIAAKANILAFLADRCQCLGIGPMMMSATLSGYVQPATPGAPPARRGTLELKVPDFPADGQAYNKAFGDPSNPLYADFSPTAYYISLQTSLSATPVYRRNCWIAGLPDASDQSNTSNIVEPNTQTALNKFIGDLSNTNTTLGGKCGISIRSNSRAGGNPIKPCTAWNVVNNTYTVPAHGFVVGQPILAQGMKVAVGGRAPRGRYLVATVPNADTISLQNSFAPSPPTKLGGFRAALVVFNLVAQVDGQGFVMKKKGAPIGRSVGRLKRPLITRA